MNRNENGSGKVHRLARGGGLALLVLLTVSACAHTGMPQVREEDAPLTLRFSPPPGMVLHERWSQRRDVRIDFLDGPRTRVVEVLSGLTEESYSPLAGGGFRVTSVAIQERTLRDGEQIEPPLSLVGIPFVHVIDAEGRFVRAEELVETIDALRKRLRRGPAKDVIEPLLEIDTLRRSMEAAWNARFQNVCNTTIAPGNHFFVIDEQELPAGGPAVSVVEQVALGQLDVRDGDALEFRLRFGGRRSPLSRMPEARELIRGLDRGALSLAERLEGEGERIVVGSSCQTVREAARILGEVRLNVEAALESGAVGLPERIRYRVDREVERSRRTGF